MAPVDHKDANGNTPLLYAAKHDQQEVAKVLLENGADSSSEDNGGVTPLHKAIQNYSIHMLQLLADQGADISHKARGRTPLLLAAELQN